MTGDPAALAREVKELGDTISELTKLREEKRDQLKSILLGEATEPPPGGWVYGDVTVHYVKASERPSLNRKKLAQAGVSLQTMLECTDFTKLKPTIKVMATGEKADEA